MHFDVRGTSVNIKLRQSQQRVRAGSGTDQGFTLVELLIVIVVLGILAGIVVFGVGRFRQDATTAACKADVATVSVAADAYGASTGNYPANLDVLVTGNYLKAAPAGGTYSFDATTKTVSRSPAC
jgi:prepilin-type N-terminal cleavage/methylation domain-containing protein